MKKKSKSPVEVQKVKYSGAFLNLMIDAGYDTLRDFLVKQRNQDAVELFDSLAMLMPLRRQEFVTSNENMMALETLALMSMELEVMGFDFGKLREAMA